MIKIAETDFEIEDCFPVMTELRPHIARADFVPTVRRLMAATNFRMVYLATDGDVKAVGGFRIAEWLAGGKYLEIEDLATRAGERSKGCGGAVFDWLVACAKENGCDQLRLVSHVRRFGAHRFYLRKRMIIEAHYFSMSLK